MSEFARNIRFFREKTGISQGELARRIGVTQSAISQYENGDATPKLAIAAKLASALGTTCEALASCEMPPEKGGES